MKKAISAIVILAALLFLGWQIKGRIGQKSDSPRGRRGGGSQVVAVELAPVTTGVIRDHELFTGSLLPKSRFVVAPKVPGRLQKLSVNIGDDIVSGQAVARLDDAEFARQVDQAQAEVEVARASAEEVRLNAQLDDQMWRQKEAQAIAELEIAKASVGESASTLAAAKREVERVRALREKRIVSEAELDEANDRFRTESARSAVVKAQVAQKEALLNAARIRLSDTQKQAREARLAFSLSQVAHREAAVAAAKLRLSYTKINAVWADARAPRIVGEKFVDEGAMLRANDKIVSILDISSVIAHLHITERDYAKVKLGQDASIHTDVYPDRTFVGKILRLAPMLNEASRELKAEVEIANAERALRPGMFVRAVIEFARREQATLVPVAALVRRNGDRGVFMADTKAGTVRFVPTTVGLVDGEVAEILAPPLTGQVVTLGQHLLEDGAAIALPRPPGAKPQHTDGRPAGASHGGGHGGH